MKSDRRRELKHNALADSLRRFPLFLNKYGPYLATALIAAAGIAWYFYNRHEANLQRVAVAQQNLNTAGEDLRRLRDDTLEIYSKGDHVKVTDGPSAGQEGDIVEVVPQRGMVLVSLASGEPAELQFSQIEELSSVIDAKDLIASRRAYYADGIRSAQAALEQAPDYQPAIRAQALVCQGDLNFTLANLPPLPGAASDLSLQPEQPLDVLMDNARTDYQQVLHDYPSELYATTAAHFGLAAIAENSAAREGSETALADWATARKEYQAVIDSGAAAALHDYAMERQALIVTSSKPLVLDLPSLVATTMPSTRSSTRPATRSSTLPLTMPSTMPSTVPAPLPATDSLGSGSYQGVTVINPSPTLQPGNGTTTTVPSTLPTTSPATRP